MSNCRKKHSPFAPEIIRKSAAEFFLAFSFCFLFMPVNIYSQEDLTDSSGITEYGGYGGPILKYSNLRNETGAFVGGYGGWLINHKYFIGIAGYGLFNRIEAGPEAPLNPGSVLYIKSSYGGFFFEYIFFPDEFLHFNLQLMIGGGQVRYIKLDALDFNYHGESSYFAAEPGINAELNVMKYIRFCAGAGFRFVSGQKLEGMKNSQLGGLGVNFTLKLGSF